MTAENQKIRAIVTGTTGMVGEGVLLECLAHPNVERVLSVTRKPYGLTHPKLTECIARDFLDLSAIEDQLSGYDACFYCAGVSSNGKTEAEYTRITYDTTLHFAETLLRLNPGMVFSHVSGSHTDGTEKGRIMWARVKGKAENALMRLPFQHVYNFRPGFMKPTPGQKNIKSYYKVVSALSPVLGLLMPNQVSTMQQVALAMINSALQGYPKQVLEVKDIKVLAQACGTVETIPK